MWTMDLLACISGTSLIAFSAGLVGIVMMGFGFGIIKYAILESMRSSHGPRAAVPASSLRGSGVMGIDGRSDTAAIAVNEPERSAQVRSGPGLLKAYGIKLMIFK